MDRQLHHSLGAVCFDAFGTLVEIKDRRRTYVPLLRALPPAARRAFTDRLMREDRHLRDWPRVLDVELDGALLDRVEASISAETTSVVMRPRMTGIWNAVRSAGLRTAICSNLARPYGRALRRVLPSPADAEVLSYKTGTIKPEPAIYRHVLKTLDLSATEVLFVGDTPSADVDGPRAANFNAMLVEDFERLFARAGICGLDRGPLTAS